MKINHIEAYSDAVQQAAEVARILPREGGLRWRPPKGEKLRLDVDYACDVHLGLGGCGAILRDCTGSVLFAMIKPTARAITTLHGELQAIVHGIKQCVEENMAPIEVYTDSMLATIVIEEQVEEESVLPEDYFNFFSMVKNLNVLSIKHFSREANYAAHELARRACSLESTVVWHDAWPFWLSNIVSNDMS